MSCCPLFRIKEKNSAMHGPCGKAQKAFLNMKESPGCDNVL